MFLHPVSKLKKNTMRNRIKRNYAGRYKQFFVAFQFFFMHYTDYSGILLQFQ